MSAGPAAASNWSRRHAPLRPHSSASGTSSSWVATSGVAKKAPGRTERERHRYVRSPLLELGHQGAAARPGEHRAGHPVGVLAGGVPALGGLIDEYTHAA